VFIPYIQEEGLRKIFSKQVLYKEEGLEIFHKAMGGIYTDPNSINNHINLTMKMLFMLLCEKHPHVSIRAIDIFMNLLGIIKNSTQKLNYDFTITDNILNKINEKLGDTIPKVRNKAVDLYCFMLKQSFCDYNNLLNELTKTEGRARISSKVVLGRLGIFTKVFDEFDNAVKDKRTDLQSFPFISIATFVIENINHAKSEVRKDVREVSLKMCKIFGFKKLKPLFEKVEERELIKLQPDIPELEEIIKELAKKKPQEPQKRSRSSNNNNKSLEKNNKSVNRSLSNSKNSLSCVYCGKSNPSFKNKEDFDKHVKEDCVLFINCIKCSDNVHLKHYNSHMVSHCKHKEEFKLCKRCKESVLQIEYDQHVKDNKCNPAKNVNSNGRCPLCHKDIQPGDKGFQQHLAKDICQKQKRREKVTFVNGT
jgi:hypothetical protein